MNAFRGTGEALFDRLVQIDTERLTIRRMTLRDADDMFEYSKDPLVAQHVLWDAHSTVSETRSYIRYTLKKYRLGEPTSLAIVLNRSNKVIGTIGFSWYQMENLSAEVGYSLSRAYWNLGIMTEALYALIEFSFRELGMNRIEAQYELSNPASGYVMRKVGMQYEGTLRSRLCNKGKFVDVALYAILRRDFLEHEKHFPI